MDQKARRLTVPAAAFDVLLSCPLCRGMSGYLDMEDLPPGVMDHEEDIDGLEPWGLNAEEVASPYVCSVSFEECSPSGRRFNTRR